MKKVCFW